MRNHRSARVRVAGGKSRRVAIEEARLPADTTGRAIAQMRRELDVMRERESLLKHELDEFIRLTAHDLHEPLRMVSCYVQLLERRYCGRLDSDADEFIQFAMDGARRMQAMVDGLSALSRVTSAGRPFRTADLNASVQSAVSALRPAIDGAGAVVRCDTLPSVLGDGAQLEQLYHNLIGNALRFSNGRRPRVHAGVENKSGEHVFFVRDNGIGIDPRYAEKVFVMFQRLHARDEYEGNGIGLAVCKRIVERHGGRIWVESEPGKGAAFRFTFRDRKEGLPKETKP
jgi:light-regulated signal transduction histidine kinase (bacteriophytochrome)